MAVISAYGMTQSGKSHHVQETYLKKVDRCIVFDFMKCFKGGDIVTVNGNLAQFKKIFEKYSRKKNFKLIIRPERGADMKLIVDYVVSLACALGRCQCTSYNPDKRVWLVIDEADRVCSSNYQSDRVKYVVNYGRHDNVDSIFIARNPSRVHTDIRGNSTKIITFKLSTALQVTDFVNNFGRENARKILTLPKYHRFEWTDTGEMKIFDANGGVTWSN